MVPFNTRLLPAPVNGGYREADHWIWCGSVIRGDDGQFHMFASRWTKDVPFNPNWLTNSRVVRAVSQTPEGPYTYVEDVLPPRGPRYWDGMMTHNPTIRPLAGACGQRRSETLVCLPRRAGVIGGCPAMRPETSQDMRCGIMKPRHHKTRNPSI